MSDNPKIRSAAAASPNAPKQILRSLAFDDDSAVREWVARNPEASPSLLWTMALTEEDPIVRGYVAWNKNAPLDLINFLAQDDDDETVRFVAQSVLDNMPKD